MTRVATCGSRRLRIAASQLGLIPVDDAEGPNLVLVELEDAEAVARASEISSELPRIVIASEDQRELLRALGLPEARIALSTDPAVLGPLLRVTLPAASRRPTKVVVLTAPKGGSGRTLLACNLAHRLARRNQVWLVDATGTGAAGWWLQAPARTWRELEPLAAELDLDQLRLWAGEASSTLRVLGGASSAPTIGLLRAVLAALAAAEGIVFVDAPLLADDRSHELLSLADRVLILSYDDPLSLAALDAVTIDESWWLIASQGSRAAIGAQPAFRALPRDEAAVVDAMTRRRSIGGSLGRAYDELAELIEIDAS